MIKTIALSIMIIFGGCATTQTTVVREKRVYVKTKCPRFNAKLSIYVNELNSTHASISWDDVAKIEAFLKAKKKFNSSVEKLNK